MGIRENLKKAYVEKALEVRRAQGDLKWKYAKKLTRKEIQECEREVIERYLQELSATPTEPDE
jgi:hypothetical protein